MILEHEKTYYIRLYMNCPYLKCHECGDGTKTKPSYWTWSGSDRDVLLDFHGYLFDKYCDDVRVKLFSARFHCSEKKISNNEVSQGKVI
jgi:hypothetical protein